jgi:tetratricopeptide (TPR) repeat protein
LDGFPAPTTERQKELMATMYLMRSLAYKNLSQWDAARSDQLLAKRLYEDLDDTRKLALVYLELARLSEFIRDYDVAKLYYLDARRMARASKDSKLIARATGELGELALRLGDFGVAKQNLRDAIDLWTNLGDADRAADLTIKLETLTSPSKHSEKTQ